MHPYEKRLYASHSTHNPTKKRLASWHLTKFRLGIVVVLLLNLGFVIAITFPLKEVKAGLTGYALTAGAGNILEQFPIEVIGLQYDVGLGFPLILVKASGDFIEASGGVAAGMSGSPVYLPSGGQDALLGAIGYVFPNSDHHLALVTPIELMRGAVPESLSFEPFGSEAFAGQPAPVAVSTPLLISGLSERASTKLTSLFANSRLTLFPVQLAAGLSLDETTYQLEPGSAVSVQLVRGDITIAGVGTVTEIEGESVLAFGHPMLGQGAVSFALASAFVSYIVPSQVVPFKLADSGQTLLGTITQDRPAAIAGRLDEEPAFLPVTLTLSGHGKTITKTFEITNDERYYAPLLAAATLQSFDEINQKVAAGTAELAWEISFKDGGNVHVLEQVTDPADIASISAGLAAAPLSILADNIFEVPEIEKVAINLRFEDEQRYAEIVEVVAESEALKPNEPLVLHVRLQPYRGEPEVKTFTIDLPEEAEGSLDIIVRGGLEPADEGNGEDKPILSFGELLVALRDNVQASELILDTYLEGDKKRLRRLSFPYLVQGEKSITITIDTEEAQEAETSEVAKAAPEGETEEPADILSP